MNGIMQKDKPALLSSAWPRSGVLSTRGPKLYIASIDAARRAATRGLGLVLFATLRRLSPLLAGVALAAGLAGCSGHTDTAGEAPATLQAQLDSAQGVQDRVDVPVIALATGAIREELVINGDLVPEDARIVYPLMDGQLSFVRPLKVGDRVKEGEVIAKIDDRDLEDQIEQQKKAIEINEERIKLDEAGLEQAKRNRDYDRELKEEGFLSQMELEKTELSLKQAEIGLRQSRIALEQEKTKLQNVERKRERVAIVAPIAGMAVLPSYLEQSESGKQALLKEDIMALDGKQVGTGSAIFGVISEAGFIVQCAVNGKDKARLVVGQPARAAVISHRPIDVTGRIAKIALLQDAKTNFYKVWVTLDQMDESFVSGLFVR